MVLWSQRDERFETGGPLYNKVPVKYPCCGKVAIRHNSSLTIFRRSERVRCEPCNKEFAQGEHHPRWKGGVATHRGYRSLRVDILQGRARELAALMSTPQVDGGHPRYILEHRLNMALHLDRPLNERETVHHRDGNKANNIITNLVILSGSDHAAEHWEVINELMAVRQRVAELEATLDAGSGG